MKSIVLEKRHRKLLKLTKQNLITLEDDNNENIYSKDWQKFLKQLG
jgi:hypothetical protein